MVECNLGKLNQVIMNLVQNALQAVGDEGNVLVRSEVANSGVLISVIDNGPGIPLEIQTRVFDPFFTTKEVGEGTGLGLSISQRIVTAHRGRLEFETEIGKGTTFKLWLPMRQPNRDDENASNAEEK